MATANPIRVQPPAEEPVTLALAKSVAKVEHSLDDDFFSQVLLPGARELAEHELHHELITQEWEQVYDAFPHNELRLLKPYVQSIVFVKYIDADGIEQTLGTSQYSLDNKGNPCFLVPAIGVEWPATLDTPNAVRIRYVLGRYVTAANVPASVKEWMLVMIITGYEHRQRIVAGMSMAELPKSYIDGMLDPHRYWGP